MRCGSCGLERHRKVSDCRLCEVLARNVALEEEVKEVRVLLAETRQQMQELEREVSVRSRASGQILGGIGEGEWRVMGRERKGRMSPPLCEA